MLRVGRSLDNGLAAFCPEIVNGGVNYTLYHLFGQLLDGLMELGWFRGSAVEASKTEYQSFVQDQRQLGLTSTKNWSDVENIFSFWSPQAGF